MHNPLNVGIIGLGILGRQYAEFLHQRPDVRLRAVCDIRRETADQCAATFGGEAFDDYRVMLDRHRLDLVVVATPDHLHRDPTLTAIEAGAAAILQEKPLATNLEDAQAIYDAVERSGIRLFLNFANRAATFDIATRYVLQHGLIGQPVYAELRLDDNISVPTRMWGSGTRAWMAGSSPAHFLLSHVVDLLRWYFAPAEITEVYAISQQRVLGDTPDLYDAFLTFNSGIKVRVKAEWIKHMDALVEFYSSFSGSKGTLIYHKKPGFATQEAWRATVNADLSPEQLIEHQRALRALGAAVRSVIRLSEPGIDFTPPSDASHMHGLEHIGAATSSAMGLVEPILDAIHEGTLEPARWRGNGPLPTHIDGMRQVHAVLAIIESSRTGMPVSVPR